MYIHDTPNSFPLKMKRNFIITFFFVVAVFVALQNSNNQTKHLISSKHAFSVSGINIFYRMVYFVHSKTETVGTIETHQTITT